MKFECMCNWTDVTDVAPYTDCYEGNWYLWIWATDMKFD